MTTPRIPELIGRSLKQLRQPNTQEDVAFAARHLGLQWSVSSVSSMEQGNFKATTEVLTGLALVLTGLQPDRPAVSLQDLLGYRPGEPETDSLVQFSPTVEVFVSDLVSFWGGQIDARQFGQRIGEGNRLLQWVRAEGKPDYSPQALGPFSRSLRDTPISSQEQRLARKLGIDAPALRDWSLRLWGRSIVQERDEIAGPDAAPQRRGIISRDLLDQIRQAMDEN